MDSKVVLDFLRQHRLAVQASVSVQHEGEADEPNGGELERLKTVYYSAYPDGPSRCGGPGLMYVRVRPTWIRYSDYNANPPLIVEFHGKDLSWPLHE
jgi:hypothetical protein